MLNNVFVLSYLLETIKFFIANCNKNWDMVINAIQRIKKRKYK